MKTLITALLLVITTSTFSQFTPFVPDTLVNGRIPVKVLLNPNSAFPYETELFNRKVVIMTINQARGLSMYAGKYDKADEIQSINEVADSLCLERIGEFEEKIRLLEENNTAAILSYEAEKLKNDNLNTGTRVKDELIKAQAKELRRQKIQKWAAIIGGGALTILALLR